MSTRIGTLQPQARLGHSAWVAGLLAVLVGATVAFVAISLDRREDVSRDVGVQGTSANTPSELSGGVIGRIEPGRFADAARLQAQADAYLGAQAGRFADAARLQAQADAYPAAQASPGEFGQTGRRGVTPRLPAVAHDGEIFVNGEVCQQCQ